MSTRRPIPDSRAPLGVGVIGAGPAAQAIHLPALARLPDLFTVRRVFDPDVAVAETVAVRAGATAARTLDELLADPEVHVVVLCSPPAFHAEQIEAACAAGVRVILCEKPLATTREEADRARRAVQASGVPLVVGAMHEYDPAVDALRADAASVLASARHVRSSIVLPFNDRFEDWGTEVLGRPARVVGIPEPERRAAILRARLLGLAIHDLPLVRRALPDWPELEVLSARLLAPIGYLVTARTPARTLELVGSFRDTFRPEWEFSAAGMAGQLEIRFPPSYVVAGSATVELRLGDGTQRVGPLAANGYEGEWRAVAAVATDERLAAEQVAAADRLADDLDFALLVADRAADRIGGSV